MERNNFHIEKSIMVASTAVTAGGTKKYLEKYVTDLVARGIYTRIAWLTGSHGMENGQDGMNSLECLSDAIRQRNGKSQTRSFYERWCFFFSLSVEGEDPREYDPTTGQVTGIKNVATPDWAGRKPGRVPNLYKNLKGELTELEIQIVDIAHYHGKPQELIEVVEKFQPSTLIIDWSYSRGGYTAQQLTAGGVISQIILENDLSIITGRGWIKLSQEQKMVMDDVVQLQMAGDEDHHDGSIMFVEGPHGSGKTVLGIEVGRILSSKRQQTNTENEVELTFCAPGVLAGYMLETLREKHFNIEKFGNIKTIEEIFEMYQLGRYDNRDESTVDTLAKIGQALSQSRKHHVIILDQLPYTQDYTKMKKYPNVDMVVLAKANDNGEKDILPPAKDSTVRVHRLRTSFRQSWDTFMAHKYMMTHAYKTYSPSAVAAMVSDDGERCPPGQRTVWINCKDGVEDVTALETVKKVLDDERKRTGLTEEGDCKDHVSVVRLVNEAVQNYCDEQGWTCLDGGARIHGYEDDVVVILGTDVYGELYGEAVSRARRRTVFVTWPGNEGTVGALSNWSAHTATKKEKTLSFFQKTPCKKYQQCPLIGQMPEMVKIDI